MSTDVRQRRSQRGDRGSTVVELAIVAPALLALMLLVVFVGRVADTDATVRRAASEGARAASLRQQPTEAVAVARSAVEGNLAAAGVTCASLSTDVDTASFRAGGTVGVTVRCVASMEDVAFVGIPGTRTFQAHAVEVIDTYRSGP